LYLFDETYCWNNVRASLFEDMRPDGIIFMSHVPSEIKMSYNLHKLIKEAYSRKIPYVRLGVDVAGKGKEAKENVVYKDDRQGALIAVKHLLNLGHRRIGFITREPLSYSGFQHRLEGYRQALEESFVPFCEDYIVCVRGSGLRIDSTPQIEKLLKLKPRPTAVFAVSDHLAINVMEVLRQKGIRIPKDIALVGYDNILQSREVSPALTTVDACREEMGRRAAGLIMELKQFGNRRVLPRAVNVPSKLVIRASSCGVGKLKKTYAVKL
jgi:LacI family transcriptional regulator